MIKLASNVALRDRLMRGSNWYFPQKNMSLKTAIFSWDFPYPKTLPWWLDWSDLIFEIHILRNGPWKVHQCYINPVITTRDQWNSWSPQSGVKISPPPFLPRNPATGFLGRFFFRHRRKLRQLMKAADVRSSGYESLKYMYPIMICTFYTSFYSMIFWILCLGWSILRNCMS